MSGSESSVRWSDDLSLYNSESFSLKKKKAFRLLNSFIAPNLSCQILKTCSNSWSFALKHLFCVSATGRVSTDGANEIGEINDFASN